MSYGPGDDADSPVEDDRITDTALLTASREEMYGALDLFYKHVQHTISLMFALLAAVSVAVGLVLKNGSPVEELLRPLQLVGCTVLLLVVLFGIVSAFINGRYYRLYVSAMVFSALLHEECGSRVVHPWFADVLKIRDEIPPLDSEGPRPTHAASGASTAKWDDWQIHEMVRRRTYGWGHSWALYTLLIAFMVVAAILGGVGLFLLN